MDHLTKTYCSSIGVGYVLSKKNYVNGSSMKWSLLLIPQTTVNKTTQILGLINKAVNFENFLQTKFVGKKRFSLEESSVIIT